MARTNQPLLAEEPIVDPATGKPTFYFLRMLLESGLFTDGIDTDLTDIEAQIEALLNTEIVAGAGLTGGGVLSDGTITISEIDPDGEAGGGGGCCLPVVDSSIPPTFIQNPDGGLVYTEIE